MRQFFRRMWSIYAPFKASMFKVLGLIVLGQLFALVSPYALGQVFDLLISKSSGKASGEAITSSLLIFVGLFFACQLFQNVVILFIRERIEIRHLDRNISERMSARTLAHYLSLSIGQHTASHSSVKRRVIEKGQDAASALGPLLVYDLAPIVFEMIIMVGALMFLGFRFGLVALVGIVAYTYVAWQINVRTRKGRLQYKKLEERVGQVYDESLLNVELVISSGQEARSIRQCGRLNRRLDQVWRRLFMWTSSVSIARNGIVDLTKIAIVVLGVVAVFTGEMTPGVFLILMGWTQSALARLGRIGSLQRDIVRHFDSMRRYFQFLDLKCDVPVQAHPVQPTAVYGQIEFRNVTMTYPGQQAPALKDLSFVIRPGEKIALVGESGAGKSSVIRALFRYQDPDGGQVLVDGHDLRLLDPGEWRRKVGRVEQDVSLFDMTLRKNIAYAASGPVTEEAIAEACRLARVDRFLPRLSKGLDTLIGERGQKLSGGERQRVGIARALVKNPPVLVFDEATSSLDSENEFEIHEAIDQASIGRTVIIIAHRLSTIQKVDRVIVFDKGGIAGVGKHSELLASCEEYRRLVRRQTSVSI